MAMTATRIEHFRGFSLTCLSGMRSGGAVGLAASSTDAWSLEVRGMAWLLFATLSLWVTRRATRRFRCCATQ